MPTEMTRSWHEGYLLVQFPQLDPEPRLKANFHMGSDEFLSQFLLQCMCSSIGSS